MPEYTTGVQQVAPDGDYDFVVDDAGEKESSKGNPMIELQLLVNYNGSEIRPSSLCRVSKHSGSCGRINSGLVIELSDDFAVFNTGYPMTHEPFSVADRTAMNKIPLGFTNAQTLQPYRPVPRSDEHRCKGQTVRLPEVRSHRPP